MNINSFLQSKSREFGTRTAVVSGEYRLSYTELHEQTNRMANFLRGLGVGKGERVVILLPNSIEFAISYIGVSKIGAVAVPLDPRFKTTELFTLCSHATPRVIIGESDTIEQLIAALPRLGFIKHIIEVGSRYPGRFLNFRDALAGASPGDIKSEASWSSIAHIGYTSAPISKPHGVMLSHGNILSIACMTSRVLKETENDAMMVFALPMHHVFGLIPGLFASFAKGGKSVILPGLSLNILLGQIEKEKGTIFLGVPYIYVLLVRMAEQEDIKYDLSSLRLCFSGGDRLPDKVAFRFKELYGLDINQLYGLTEATATVTCTNYDGAWKLGSAGRLLPGWELKILTDEGKEASLNEPGEIVIRGQTMKGYYNDPEATSKAITNGWLKTGDIGKVDEEGDVFILGLKKKMIIVKGQNIWPVDIEKVLKAHPNIAEAVVIGVPDELRGETVGAAVGLKEGKTITEEEIRRHCRQYLVNYKIPKRILILDAIPRGADGIPEKERLIEMLLRIPVESADPRSQVTKSSWSQ